jgi:hypothetical protein
MLSLFKYPPKNAWGATLTQLLLWCFRRFCVIHLLDEKTTGEEDPLWSDSIDLITSYAPQDFKPHLNDWLTPEHMSQILELNTLDRELRALVVEMDAAVEAGDEERQDAISDFVDFQLRAAITKWLGATYAPYLLFPQEEEPDDEIDKTKLNSIVLLLKVNRNPSLRKTLRAKAKFQKRAVTRRRHEPVQLPVRSKPHGEDAREGGGASQGSESGERQGHEDAGRQEERKDTEDDGEAEQGGDQEHQGAQVHAASVPQVLGAS